ncbi:WXG100 family type VII secretion target [Streptomyces sp. NPDC050433]|uniref:WXG100 family type VII secretion target n=1 Tax=Streptomyces sp. NPDC050433 TaxID=3365615 RepID=UPI003791422E
MTDEKKPPLSPQEQQQNEEAAQIRTEFGVVDVTERMATAMGGLFFGNSGGFFGRTSFEERGLNDMLDLLDGANPSDLENAGKNLERAKKSLNEAAQDLSDFVKATDWHGEAATNFQSYGSELARYAWDLGSFANIVGTQLTVAATGLTSVRSAKPPRDNRADLRRPKDFPVSEQREDNPEYKQAVQAEENRQEAINQMNRLASFYAVSEQSLAEAKEPVLPKMLAADVPLPRDRQRTVESGSATTESGVPDGAPQRPSAVRADADGTDGVRRTGTEGLVTEKPLPNISMEIDSVKTLPPTTTDPGPVQPPTAPTVPSSGNGHVPPLGPNLGPPVRGGPRSGPPLAPRGGGPGPVSNAKTSTGGGGRQGPVGRPTPMSGSTNSTSQSGRGPVGRPTQMGPGMGRSGGAGATRNPMVGRPSTGGQSMGGRSGSGSSSGSRTGRSNGIVGGTPQRASGGGTGGSGSRIPRGNVIGGAGNTTPGRPSSAVRPSQSGVVGAGPAQGEVRPKGLSISNVNNGVVGIPRSDGTPPKSGADGFTTGGSGLSGDRNVPQVHNEEPQRPGQPGPESRVDDAETQAGRRRSAVPPVID